VALFKQVKLAVLFLHGRSAGFCGGKHRSQRAEFLLSNSLPFLLLPVGEEAGSGIGGGPGEHVGAARVHRIRKQPLPHAPRVQPPLSLALCGDVSRRLWQVFPIILVFVLVLVAAAVVLVTPIAVATTTTAAKAAGWIKLRRLHHR
jgi:hypothetical protein